MRSALLNLPDFSCETPTRPLSEQNIPVAVILPPNLRSDRTLICQGGTRGELRQWSYAAGEVPSRGSDDDTAGGADKCNDNEKGAGSARPSESARPAPVVRKLTHQVSKYQ